MTITKNPNKIVLRSSTLGTHSAKGILLDQLGFERFDQLEQNPEAYDITIEFGEISGFGEEIQKQILKEEEDSVKSLGVKLVQWPLKERLEYQHKLVMPKAKLDEMYEKAVEKASSYTEDWAEEVKIRVAYDELLTKYVYAQT